MREAHFTAAWVSLASLPSLGFDFSGYLVAKSWSDSFEITLTWLENGSGSEVMQQSYNSPLKKSSPQLFKSISSHPFLPYPLDISNGLSITKLESTSPGRSGTYCSWCLDVDQHSKIIGKSHLTSGYPDF